MSTLNSSTENTSSPHLNQSMFSIEINSVNGSNYKSIRDLSWTNIPMFAVLTGENGTGKTQLLELLAYHFSGARPIEIAGGQLPVKIIVSGTKYQPHEVAYMPSAGRFSGGGAASLATMTNARQQALHGGQHNQGQNHDIVAVIRKSRLSNMFSKPVHNVVPDLIDSDLYDNFEFMIDDVDVTTSLAYIFMAYKLKVVEGIAKGYVGLDRHGKPNGPAPWTIINELLATSGFIYEFITPDELSILDAYQVKLRRRDSDLQIFAIDLSSGEKILLQLVLWLFAAGKRDVFPKLLLLDEPDAHLHPSIMRQFLDIVFDVLVNRHGTRVIMTTHSPSTVALSPKGSLFRMEREVKFVTAVEDRPAILSILTAGLVTVFPTTKFCFVEAQSDVDFYETVRKILVDYGPSRDPMALRPSPSIAFIPASLGEGSAKIGGGSTVVTKWVNKLDADPLKNTFLGIIDRDVNNKSNERIFVIGRYSFENYLLDPLIVFSLLLEEGLNPVIEDLDISTGDEHRLRFQNEAVLQRIVNYICSSMMLIEPLLDNTQNTIISYTVGRRIEVPIWVVSHRGHNLLPIAQEAFGGPKIINPPRLLKALRRCRFIPSELAILLQSVQTA